MRIGLVVEWVNKHRELDQSVELNKLREIIPATAMDQLGHIGYLVAS